MQESGEGRKQGGRSLGGGRGGHSLGFAHVGHIAVLYLLRRSYTSFLSYTSLRPTHCGFEAHMTDPSFQSMRSGWS